MTPTGRVVVGVAAVFAVILLTAVNVAIWRTDTSVWIKAVGSAVSMLALTGFAVRMWLVGHPYGTLPRWRR